MPLTKLNILIVHAHHEPKSFCSALFRHTVETLTDAGHHVVTSDLYAQRFDPVSDRRNFTSTFDANYLKQGKEERHATAVGGFAPDLELEIRKLESCDLLVFSYPLWWFAMPAILKGWVDRTFAYARIFGDTRLYENGLGQGRKRAMIVMTTGGDRETFGPRGTHPSLESILTPIEHGIFWFNGFLPLEPFVAFQPARITHGERTAYLHALGERLQRLEHERPRRVASSMAWAP
jgi:NAD(P)H dehydrogenase (quinone)